MIQRIQSIWLLLAAICAFLGYRFAFYAGNLIGPDRVKAFHQLSAATSPANLVLTALAGTMALVAIFLYKNRVLQLRLTWGALLLSLINLIVYYLQSQKFLHPEAGYSLGAAASVLIPVFLFLAARGIRKDQKLVKSLDRLR